MFNPDLPSGRRKLFLFILLVFTIAGFSAKYLLIELGWVSNQATESKHITSPGNEPNSQAESGNQPIFTQEDIQNAQQIATSFLPVYVTSNDSDQDERLVKLKPLITSQFFAVLKEEAELARPTSEKLSTRLERLGNINCELDGIYVKCLIETVIEEKESNGQKKSVEKVYQILLVQEGREWLVQEVELHGSID